MDCTYNKIKNLRKFLGITQNDFARMLEITQNHLSNIEKGERNITIDMALKICEMFDISMDWLIRDIGEPPTRTYIVQKYETLLNQKQGFSV